MKKLVFATSIWACFIGVAVAQPAETETPPPLIPFTGAVTDSSGEPLGGLVSAIFGLYEEAEGGVPLWVDIQTVQADAAGGYLALLGGATELPVDLFATSQALWLSVQPEGQAEQPRVRFFSVPYALKASDADTLGGRPLSEFMLVDGASADGGGGGECRTTASSDKAITNDLTRARQPDRQRQRRRWDRLSVSRLSIEGPEADFRLTRAGGASFLFQAGAGPNPIEIRGLTANPMSFWTNNVQRLFIESGGNVGIGTTGPAAKLDVAGDLKVVGKITFVSPLFPTGPGTIDVLATSPGGFDLTQSSPSSTLVGDTKTIGEEAFLALNSDNAIITSPGDDGILWIVDQDGGLIEYKIFNHEIRWFDRGVSSTRMIRNDNDGDLELRTDGAFT